MKRILSGTIPLVLLFSSIIFTSCNYRAKSQNKTENYYFESEHVFLIDSGYLPGMRVINNADTTISLQFTINNRIWFRPDDMLQYIRDMKTDSLPQTGQTISNAFHFVVNYTEHKSEIPLPKAHDYSPGIFINSLGYGECDNRGAVLALILKGLGYQSRCVQLSGHVVTEVFDNGKWKMLDADNNIYFIKDNDIASTDEIAHQIKGCKPVFGKNAMNIFIKLMPQRYFSLFTTYENNRPEDWYVENIFWEETSITLPPGAELEFPAVNPLSDKASPYLFACLKIKKTYVGKINIPFVIHSAQGKGFVFNSQDTVLYPQYIQKEFQAPGNYSIISDSAEIYFYVNPFILNDISDTAYVNIFSTCENEIKVISKPYKKHTNLAYVWLKKYDTLLEDVGNFYKTYYETDESFLNDTTAINTKEEFRKKIINFYLKTHSGKTVLDRITKKIDHALLLISQYSADETEFFRPLNVPFFRYTLIICIIELPESAIDESFDYFFK